MAYTLHHNSVLKRFEFDLGEGSFAFVEYTESYNRFQLVHTEVPKQHSGKGIAAELALAVFTWMRENNRKADAYCPFLVTWLKRHKGWDDVAQIYE